MNKITKQIVLNREVSIKRMKRILNKKLKDIIKSMLIFFAVMFIMTFIACSFQGESNPLQTAIQVTAFFFGVGTIGLVGYIVFDYLSEKNVQFNKLSKVDFINSKEMYRDLLTKYSPVMLAYIDEMHYDYDISIVSGILSLKNKGFIEVEEDKINIVKFDFYNLGLPEKYIIENIRNGKVQISETDDQLKFDIFEEAKRKGLIVSDKSQMRIFWEKFKKLMLITLIFISVWILFCFLTGRKELINVISSDIVAIAWFLGYIYMCVYAIKFEKNPYIRTKSAEELNIKLEGLKNYLKEYSLLKDKESKDIVLWEDYLIYSVIFNQNNSILSEYKKYYTD